MLKTIELIEKQYNDPGLYRRRLELSDSAEEGVFLAASQWMPQYYIMKEDLKKCEKLFEKVLKFSTDLGFLAKEGDMKTGAMLGNIPKAFTHASFIGAILDNKNA